MRWRRSRRSENIEDRRRSGGGGRRGGGLPIGGGSVGMILVALAAAYFLGVDPSVILNQGLQGQSAGPASASYTPSAEEEQLAEFISVVLADTEDTWNVLFQQQGGVYQEPKLVLFSGSVRSACGFAKAAMGPFYCPGDRKVYIDLSFYDDLRRRHGAPGDFAQAYVVAHEIGHHVQTLLGISQQVHQARSRVSKVEGNQLSVRQELQADCFAGLWAHHAQRTRQILEEGDLEEAMRAATAIGDDRLQKQSRGYVTPESFTHGTSKQRVRWFKVGLQQGTVAACNTFETNQL
ncbi:MAG: KPN_02809 family neutral zinc metallopeptidase [Gammaproteobacteria bacterium]